VQHDTAFLRSASRAFANRLALNAPEDHTAVEKAPSPLRFAGAVQNALVETQRPINLAGVGLPNLSKGLLDPASNVLL